MTRLVYILAASHSGSTLLGMLLGAHAQTCTAGELKLTSLGHVERYMCSCGQRVRACGFWQEVGRRMAARGIDFDIADARTDLSAGSTAYVRRFLRPLHRGPLLERCRDVALGISPAWRGRLREFRQRNAALAEVICSVRNVPVIVDSSKVALRLKYLLGIPDLDVKVVRLIRDGRGVALAHLDPARYADAQDPSRRGGGWGGSRDSEVRTMAQAAWEWRRSNEEAEHSLGTLDTSRHIRVCYEDLCREPDVVLSRLFDFVGVNPCERIRDFRAAGNHVVGNGMRLDSTPRIALDERWREMLTREDLRTFDAIAGPLNRRYGYE